MTDQSVYIIEVASRFRCPSPSPISLMLRHCTSDWESLGPSGQNVPHNGEAGWIKNVPRSFNFRSTAFIPEFTDFKTDHLGYLENFF